MNKLDDPEARGTLALLRLVSPFASGGGGSVP